MMNGAADTLIAIIDDLEWIDPVDDTIFTDAPENRALIEDDLEHYLRTTFKVPKLPGGFKLVADRKLFYDIAYGFLTKVGVNYTPDAEDFTELQFKFAFNRAVPEKDALFVFA
jgi:hypothetical protein